MKTELHSPHRLNAAGVGPKIIRSMFPFLLAAIAFEVFLPSFSAIPVIGHFESLNIAGWILTVTGLLLWSGAVIQFAVGFSKGKLITNGFYSLSRNPIYVTWIIFILPGLALVFNNWIFLLAALAMYIAFRRFIAEEEKMLTQVFGENYLLYKKKVNRLL